MGCKASVPVEKAKPEPVPDYATLLKTKIHPIAGEPQLTSGEDSFVDEDAALSLIFRQIGASNKGNTFQIETYEDSLFNRLQIHPAKPGIGVKKRLEDLIFLHYENIEKALGFAIKNVPRGLNFFMILSPTPLGKAQKPANFEGPPFCKVMYPYASVEFNLETNVASVKVAGQGKGDPPLYTIRQCNAKVWVIKRRDIVCAAIESVRGMAKLSCYKVLLCAGTDPALMSLLASCIDSFLETAKTQYWTFYDKSVPFKSIDWPQLDEELEEKLFGRKGFLGRG